MSFKSKLAVLGAASMIAAGTLPAATLGSSHREAPLIAKDPSADNTDLYAFVSPDAPDTVTLIANYTGLQEPAGGPNFFPFDPEVKYWIKIDNTGDGVADHTITFDFNTQVANPDSFLFSGYGPISADTKNVTQTYSVSMDDTAIGSDLSVPPPNIGPRTTPDYTDYPTVHELDGNVKAFAGQRDDPFFVDLGAIFDLGGLRPFNPIHLLPLPAARGQDDLAKFNVNSIAIQVPKSMLTKDGEDVTAADADNAVIGIWAGASRQATTVLSAAGAPELTGDYVQVSRLGNPLINEVIIPLGQKDEWNRGEPSGDAEYTDRYLNPELAAIINTIYPATEDIDTSGRSDLVLILGQGVPGLNATNTGDTLYDMLRLNMGVPPTASPNRLGVPAGDLAGFPNGRRLWDDVVDIELKAVAQGYGEFLATNFGLPNKSPNNMVGDGCDANDVAFTSSFPYLGVPAAGYQHGEHHTTCGAMPPSDTLAVSSSSTRSSADRAIVRSGARAL